MKGGVYVLSPRMLKVINAMPDSMVGFIAKKMFDFYVRKYANIKIEGMENIDKLDKSVIFICNHLSNSDGLILSKVLKAKEPTFVAGVKLTDNNFTKLGFYLTKTIPIKPNSADKEAISKIIDTLKSGGNIVIFPEGTRSRTGSMIEGKKGLLLMAKLSKAQIVPIGMWGTENLMPINDGNMAAEKFNYADVNIKIGKPMNLPEKNKEEDRAEYQDRAMHEIMLKIAELIPEKYRGVYSSSKTE